MSAPGPLADLMPESSSPTPLPKSARLRWRSNGLPGAGRSGRNTPVVPPMVRSPMASPWCSTCHPPAPSVRSRIFAAERTLLEQTVRELSRQLPGVAIGSYYGEVKQVARHGVNVVTYGRRSRSCALT